MMSTPHKRSKKIGILLILGPIVGIFCVLLAYSILSTVMFGLGASMTYRLPFAIANYVLALLGFIFLITIPVGIVVGIIYLRKKEYPVGIKFDERSGEGKNSVIPTEISGWNWGAAGLNWIWGIYHNVWIALLCFVPIVNIIMIVVLGFKGNEYAWRAEKWPSVEVFLAAQKKWRVWGIVFIIFSIVSLISRLNGKI